MSKQEWCWENPSSKEESIYGPFDSKEECVEHAQKYLNITDSLLLPGIGQKVKINIGKVTYLSPKDYVIVDIADMLERMEDEANQDYGFDDSIFDTKPGAEEKLKKALETWAQEYLTCSGWYMTDPEETEI